MSDSVHLFLCYVHKLVYIISPYFVYRFAFLRQLIKYFSPHLNFLSPLIKFIIFCLLIIDHYFVNHFISLITILWINIYHWSLFCELTCTVYHFALNNIKIFKFLNSNSSTFVSLPQPYRNSPPPAPAKSLHAIWERRVSLSRRREQASKVRKAGNKERK